MNDRRKFLAAAGSLFMIGGGAGAYTLTRGKDDVLELNISNPQPSNQYEGEIPYDVDVISTGEAIFDMQFDGEEIISQTIPGDETFEGTLPKPDEEGRYTFGVGVSPRAESPGRVDDVSEHEEYKKFRIGFTPREVSNGSEDDVNRICEQYAGEDTRAFENILTANYDTGSLSGFEGDLEDVHVRSTEDGYFWRDRPKDITALLNGDSNNHDEMDLSDSFAQTIHTVYNQDRDEFTQGLYDAIKGRCN